MDVNVPETRRRHRLGLPLWQLVGLAALAMPRVFVHDAGGRVGWPVQALLVFGPPLVWLAVAVLRRIPSPVITLLAVGGLYGAGVAVVHNLFWSDVFGNRPPRLGGNLADQLSPGTEELVFRLTTSASSLLTGLMVGLITGLLAVLVRRLARR
ncbi:hypothetical protein O7626_18315 [Micromonospora sp. WMMD1102]|uniref:hypothetical protein n=1 Tax=Micromonospora sp. WMMD1102 TaxID=3016105 RepID=UPI002414D076|nr:hypothetical protein [Micromonospora sp. WMMD1102]MDG4787870.1 hypothetical protein [Micromonospora sp. WMMD1102]